MKHLVCLGIREVPMAVDPNKQLSTEIVAVLIQQHLKAQKRLVLEYSSYGVRGQQPGSAEVG